MEFGNFFFLVGALFAGCCTLHGCKHLKNRTNCMTSFNSCNFYFIAMAFVLFVSSVLSIVRILLLLNVCQTNITCSCLGSMLGAHFAQQFHSQHFYRGSTGKLFCVTFATRPNWFLLFRANFSCVWQGDGNVHIAHRQTREGLISLKIKLEERGGGVNAAVTKSTPNRYLRNTIF